MKLSAPKQTTFWIAVVIAVVGVIARFAIPTHPSYALLLVVIAFIVLAAGNLIEGL